MSINGRIQNSVSSLLSPYSSRYSVGFHLRMSGILSDFKEKKQYENFLTVILMSFRIVRSSTTEKNPYSMSLLIHPS